MELFFPLLYIIGGTVFLVHETKKQVPSGDMIFFHSFLVIFGITLFLLFQVK